MNKTNIIRCLLYLMFIMVCADSTELNNLNMTMLTDVQNEQRLDNCGKPPEKPLSRKDHWWFSLLQDANGTVYHAMGAILISPIHAIIGEEIRKIHDSEKDGNLKTKSWEGVKFTNKVGGKFEKHNYSLSFDLSGNKTSIGIKKAAYHQITKFKGFALLELEESPELPYACVGVYATLSPSNTNVGDHPIFTPTKPTTTSIGFKVIFEKGEGNITYQTSDKSPYWQPNNWADGWESMDKTSIPLFSTAKPHTLIGIASHKKSNIKGFAANIIDETFLNALCEDFGFCPRKATTTTTTTTTTTPAPTTPKPTTTVPTTTYYVPKALGYPEMMDFEMDYDVPVMMMRNCGKRTLVFVCFFMVYLVMG